MSSKSSSATIFSSKRSIFFPRAWNLGSKYASIKASVWLWAVETFPSTYSLRRGSELEIFSAIRVSGAAISSVILADIRASEPLINFAIACKSFSSNMPRQLPQVTSLCGGTNSVSRRFPKCCPVPVDLLLIPVLL